MESQRMCYPLGNNIPSKLGQQVSSRTGPPQSAPLSAARNIVQSQQVTTLRFSSSDCKRADVALRSSNGVGPCPAEVVSADVDCGYPSSDGPGHRKHCG
jgi:hypothetical protein